MAKPFELTKGDTSRSFKGYLRANPGSNFTGATAVFSMRHKDGATKINKQPAPLSSDAGGFFGQYDWVAGDVDTAGDFEGHIKVTLASGKIETYPNGGHFAPIKIGEDIG